MVVMESRLAAESDAYDEIVDNAIDGGDVLRAPAQQYRRHELRGAAFRGREVACTRHYRVFVRAGSCLGFRRSSISGDLSIAATRAQANGG